jgi:hypothetical protein
VGSTLEPLSNTAPTLYLTWYLRYLSTTLAACISAGIVKATKTMADVPTTADHKRTSLLGLPRELRDIILLSLVCQTTPPPKNPDHAGPRESTTTSPCTIYFSAASPRPALLQLKLCNRQLHAEVRDTLTKHGPSDPLRAQLDIMARGSCIWPTWTHLPVTPTLSPVLSIHLRIFEALPSSDRRAPVGLYHSEFSTSAPRALYDLLQLLQHKGLCSSGRSPSTNPNPSPAAPKLSKLELNITTLFPTFLGHVIEMDDEEEDDLHDIDILNCMEKTFIGIIQAGPVYWIEARLGGERRAWTRNYRPIETGHG